MTDAGSLRDHYRDLTEIDRRPEGIRYSASLSDGTPVVALAIAPDVVARVRYPERFSAAFDRAAAIQHEALAQPLSWGVASDGALHCSYARRDLQPLVPGSLSAAGVAAMGQQLARALTIAHGAGLVHGAITVERITLAEEHGAQLTEFGLFAALCEGGLGVVETTALLSGTAYVSPELLLGKNPDEHSDIYSLGASLYGLLTGKPPYGGRTTSSVMASVLSSSANADSRDDFASPVVEALLRAIESAPDDRWPTAAAFATALAAGVPSGELAAASAAQRRRGCLPATAAAIGGVLLVGAASAYLLA